MLSYRPERACEWSGVNPLWRGFVPISLLLIVGDTLHSLELVIAEWGQLRHSISWRHRSDEERSVGMTVLFESEQKRANTVRP